MTKFLIYNRQKFTEFLFYIFCIFLIIFISGCNGGDYDANTAPSVTITSPNGGATYNQGNLIIFTGSGTDTENGLLTGGSLVWTSNIDAQIGTGASFTTTTLSTETHIITLTATDSNGAATSATVEITVAPVGFPTADITSPANNSTYNFGDIIVFTGSGTDGEDGALTYNSLVWTSNIDAQIGTGAFFTTTTLSVGTHTITLTATDSNGATGSASVSITVGLAGSYTLPIANITSPANNSTYNFGDIIVFTGSGTDAEDGALTGNSLVWISSINAQIGTGAFFTTTTLSVGTHTIVLIATDSDGATGSDIVEITVN